MRYQFSHIFLKTLSLILLAFFANSCAINRHLEPNEKLLVRNSISCDNRKIDKDEMYNYIQQKPNRKTFGMLIRHRIYNSFIKSEKKFGTWIREKIGEVPVIYDSVFTKKSAKQLSIYMHERGYYSEKIHTETKVKGTKDGKIKVKYFIESGEPYVITNIDYDIPDSSIYSLVTNDKTSQKFAKQKAFDLEELVKERKRLAELINNKGYFGITTNDIFFTADTTKGNLEVDLTIGVSAPDRDNNEFKKYKIRNTIVYPDFNPSLSAQDTNLKALYSADSTTKYLYNNFRYVKPNVIERSNYIENGAIYNRHHIFQTQRRLSNNKLFKIVNIDFDEVKDSTSGYKYIDCIIKISPVTQQAFTVELESTNTAGDWGAELNLSYTHKNLAKGSENLQVKVTTAGEYNSAFKTDDDRFTIFNTFEYGAEVKLEIPKFLLPFKPEKFDLKYKPTTQIRAAYNYMRSTNYTRPTSQVSYGYIWPGNKFLTHDFNLIDISYINYLEESFSEEFKELLESRDYYKYSYEDYLIYSLNYALTFSNKNSNVLRDYMFYKIYFESSGNLEKLAAVLFNWDRDSDDRHTTFKVPFAQYIKIEGDYRYYKVLDKKKQFVSRIFAGVAVPYGNSSAIPSVKKYFVGGANSLRGWASRSVGPGSFSDSTQEFKYYLGDIKLEANFEYRFDMFWVLEGAAFIDIGNIWTFSDDELKGAKFTSKFLDQLAISTGLGLRFDFSFFVFRTDVGLKFREPIPISGKKSHIIWGNRKLRGDDFNLSFGIGYPF